MEKSKIIFSLNGKDETIECSKEEKMRNVCQKYATKIEAKLDSLLFLYGENQLNFLLSFEDQANSTDKLNNEMKVLVTKKEGERFICPKFGEKIE